VTPSPRSSGSKRRATPLTTAQTLAEQVVGGDRRALARAITLVESTRPDHRHDAAELLDALLPHTGRATRIGISGAPGVGKSVFIEAFGLHLTAAGHKVAVLAVDPSSVRSGGSILGDKTRMEELAKDPNAYIRPTPSGGALGGVARRTREAMLVCEAAGFDVVIVETVGVGQSETEVDHMVDVFVLLIAPGGGDELQGMKRGVMELVDVLVVTKADGELKNAATQAAGDYRHALHLLRPKHADLQAAAAVAIASALHHEGIDEVWQLVSDHERALKASGRLSELRALQATTWLWSEIREGLLERLTTNERVQQLLAEMEPAVAEGRVSPTSAAQRLLAETEIETETERGD
jgi:LAO/AO transport system kinase